MRIKILNKNLSNSSYSSAKSYEIDEAPVFTEVYNETLDTGNVIISNQSSVIEMSPYDVVAIYFDNGSFWKYMCIDTYTETLTCVNPKIYKYEITLFSETKMLEGTILPNLKITKMPGITRSIYHYIEQYMNEYCPKIRVQRTIPYRWENKFKLSNTLASKFSDECPEMQWNTPTLREVLNDLMMVKDCIPVLKNGTLEFMDLTEISNVDWSNDTTHINYVTRSKSSEDYVSELQVKLVNVTNKESDIDNTVTRTEYSTLSTPDEDVILTTNNFFIKTQYPIYKLKSVVLTFAAPSNSGNTSYKWISIDLMNINSNGHNFTLIEEYEKWKMKDIIYNADVPSNFSDWPKSQNWSLYYIKGTQNIQGFQNSTKHFLWETKILYEQLWEMIVKNNGGTVHASDPYFAIVQYYNVFVKVEYETLEGCLFRASKGDVLEHERIIIDNQTNSYVDSYNQGFLEYQKANRLGNEQLYINARFVNEDDSWISIAEKYDDAVIYQVQKQFFKNHIEINAQATKNYVLREYFTGVKSKIRSWRIASGSEALTRHDLIKYYCEFSYNKYSERTQYTTGDDFTRGLDYLAENNMALYLISPLTNYTAQPIKYCFVRTQDSTDAHHPDNFGSEPSYYCLDLMRRLVGNSLVFTFEFLDSYWAGKSFHTSMDGTDSTGTYIGASDIADEVTSVPTINMTNWYSIGGIPTYQHVYTDDNAENVGGEIILTDGIHVSFDQYSDDVEDETIWGEYIGNGRSSVYPETQSYLWAIYQRPRTYQRNFKYDFNGVEGYTNYNYEKVKTSFNFHKDSQEITNMSVQLEFCSDTINICFSKEWLKRQKAISATDNTTVGYKLYRFDVSKYNFRNPDDLPTDALDTIDVKLGYRQLVGDNSSLNIRAVIALDYIGLDSASEQEAAEKGRDFAEDSCFYLTDANNKVLLAFRNIPAANIGGGEINEGLWVPTYEIVLNILASRNKNIYSQDDNPYLIVDKI